MITDDTEVRAQGCGRGPRPSARVLTAPRAGAQVRYVVGGSFVTVPNDDAETRLQSGAPLRGARHAPTLQPLTCVPHVPPPAATEEAGSEVERLNGERETIVKEMTRLKGVLYAKFGDAINLED